MCVMDQPHVDSPPKKSPNVHKCPHPGCSATFTRPFRLKTHLNVHNGEHPYKCEEEGCGRAYANNTSLQRHKQLSHNPLHVKLKYNCVMPGCFEEFCSTTNLRRHIERIHLKQHPFTCSTCQKGFKTSDQLKTHEFEHTSISPFRCDLCGTGYLTAYDLRRHNRKHKRLLCPICGLEFTDAMLLRKHHGLEHKKSYNCSYCGKLFYNKAMLTQHEVVHLDPSQRVTFACPYETCSRVYFAKRNVDSHIRAFHEGKKERQRCHVCSKILSNKQKLKHHLQLHVRDGIPVENESIVVKVEVDVNPEDEMTLDEETVEDSNQEVESEDENYSNLMKENDLGNSTRRETEVDNLENSVVLKCEPVFGEDECGDESRDSTPLAIPLQISSNDYSSNSENEKISWTNTNSDDTSRTDEIPCLFVKVEPCENIIADPVL